jgi:hypothetical protein
MLRRGGKWQVEPDGTALFFPDEDATEGPDPFSGVDDSQPPNSREEHFCAREEPVGDAFTPVGWLEYPPSRSFLKESRRWQTSRMPLRVYVTEKIKLTRAGMITREIERSLHDWSAVLPEFKYQYTEDFKNADIYFLERNTANDEWADNERFYSKNGLDEVRISLHWQTCEEVPQLQLRAILLHEMGHALGIIDHLNGFDDVMSERACDEKHPTSKLSEDDAEDIRLLYSGPDHPPKIPQARELTYRRFSN